MKPKRDNIVLWCQPGLSGNKVRTSHWSSRYKLDQKIKQTIGWQVASEAAYIPSVRIDPKHPVKRLVVLTRYWGGRSKEMDQDNLAMAGKPIIDALKMNKGAGVIVDDNPDWVEVQYKQEKTALQSWQGQMKVEVYL